MRDFLLFITVVFAVGSLVLSIICAMQSLFEGSYEDSDEAYVNDRIALSSIFAFQSAVFVFISIKLATNA